MFRPVLAPALAVLSLYGCAETTAPVVRHARPFPQTAALLPFANDSNSVIGPVLIRKLLEDYLSGSSLDVQDTAETDSRLRTIGITDAGQFRATSNQKMGELLEVEVLFYGELIDFSYTNVGVLSKRSVKFRLAMVDAKTGEKLWESERASVNSKAGLSADSIKDNFASGLGTKLVEKAMGSPLRPESEDVVHELLRDLTRAKQGWH
jgi:hypothetical protein